MTPTTIKWAIGAAILAAYSGLWFYLGGLYSAAAFARLQRDNAQSEATAYHDRETAHQVKEVAYEKEIHELKDAALSTYPTVAVRMCQSNSTLPATGKSRQVLPADPRMGTGDTKQVPQSEGPDYGPSLFGLADALDSITAKCRSD